ncbi:MAG: hypothetical protein IMZ66_03275, partial [Planctomycetes bacterium]|nr:hypothetical protein [Planctomycetota bacterium]
VLALAFLAGRGGLMGPGSLAALAAIAAALTIQHVLALRTAPERIAARFFRLNAMVSILWLAGVVADVAIGPHRHAIAGG